MPIGYPAADTFQDPFLVLSLQIILTNYFYRLFLQIIFIDYSCIFQNQSFYLFTLAPTPGNLGFSTAHFDLIVSSGLVFKLCFFVLFNFSSY